MRSGQHRTTDRRASAERTSRWEGQHVVFTVHPEDPLPRRGPWRFLTVSSGQGRFQRQPAQACEKIQQAG